MALGTNATINDDVWDQLDPYAARLSTKDRYRVWAVVGGTTVIAVTVTALWWFGALTPQMSLIGEFDATAPGPAPTFTLVMSVMNDTQLTMHPRSIGRS